MVSKDDGPFPILKEIDQLNLFIPSSYGDLRFGAMDQRVVQLEEWTLIIWRWLTSFYHDEYGEDLASSVISEKFQEANKKIGDLQEEVRVLKMKVEFLEQTVDGLKDKKINLLENTVTFMLWPLYAASRTAPVVLNKTFELSGPRCRILMGENALYISTLYLAIPVLVVLGVRLAGSSQCW